MFTLARAVTYATLFIGFVLVAVPARVLTASGFAPPVSIGSWQVAGLLAGVTGAAIALTCVLTFVFVGHGTPAPFDPPRKLVIAGPYRFVRNPMYLGAALAMSGAALYFRSLALFVYVGAFLLAAHLFVVAYEEPTLRHMFGHDYDRYCHAVGRWWIRRHA
jgi:protein-S-isoprenylcysteine O-methyltransferase Ste14